MWVEMKGLRKLGTKKRMRKRALLRGSSVLQSRFTKENYYTLKIKSRGRHMGVHVLCFRSPTRHTLRDILNESVYFI